MRFLQLKCVNIFGISRLSRSSSIEFSRWNIMRWPNKVCIKCGTSEIPSCHLWFDFCYCLNHILWCDFVYSAKSQASILNSFCQSFDISNVENFPLLQNQTYTNVAFIRNHPVNKMNEWKRKTYDWNHKRFIDSIYLVYIVSLNGQSFIVVAFRRHHGQWYCIFCEEEKKAA